MVNIPNKVNFSFNFVTLRYVEVFLGVKNYARNIAFREALAFFEEEYNMLFNDVILK